MVFVFFWRKYDYKQFTNYVRTGFKKIFFACMYYFNQSIIWFNYEMVYYNNWKNVCKKCFFFHNLSQFFSREDTMRIFTSEHILIKKSKEQEIL